MLRSFTGQTTRPPFPHLVLFGVWVVLPLQLYLHNFFIEPPLCDVKEKLVREKEEKKGPSKLVFDRWNRILISIYATKEKMMMI